MDTELETQSESSSRHNTIRIHYANKEVRKTNQEVRATKRQRRMMKIITVRSRVSGKHGNLIINP